MYSATPDSSTDRTMLRARATASLFLSGIPNGAEKGEGVMPKFLIEREVPGAGQLAPGELTTMAQKSCSVLNELGSAIQWVQS